MDILVFPVKGNTQNCTLISNSYLKQPEDFVIYGNSIIFISHNKIQLNYLNYGPRWTNKGIFVRYIPQKNSFSRIRIDDYPLQDFIFHPEGANLLVNRTLYTVNHAYSYGGERIEYFKLIVQNEELSLKYKGGFELNESYYGRIRQVIPVNNKELILLENFEVPDSKKGKNHQSNYLNLGKNLWNFLIGKKQSFINLCSVDEKNSKIDCKQLPNTGAISHYSGVQDKYQRIFITNPFEKEIIIYKLENKQFIRLGSILIGGYPLNIQYNKENDEFYIGCLYKITDLVKVYWEIKKKGGIERELNVNSMVIRIKNQKNILKVNSYEEIIRSREGIQGIFSAGVVEGIIVASSGLGDELLQCQL